MTGVTPMDLQDKPVPEYRPYRPKKKVNNEYSTKFKSAVYAAVLFILFSHKVAYKILDVILKLFSNRIEVIDDDEVPQLLGTLILAALIGFIIFIF